LPISDSDVNLHWMAPISIRSRMLASVDWMSVIRMKIRMAALVIYLVLIEGSGSYNRVECNRWKRRPTGFKNGWDVIGVLRPVMDAVDTAAIAGGWDVNCRCRDDLITTSVAVSRELVGTTNL